MDLTNGTKKQLDFIAASSARDLDVRPDTLAIADTFGHKVTLYNRETGVAFASIEEYFPNKVHFLSGTDLLILGEHSNRLSIWDFKKNTTKFIFGHDSGNLKTNFHIASWIKAEQSLALHANKSFIKTSPSKASLSFSGTKTLYSPNSFVVFNKQIFIADTDNHRIIAINTTGDITTIISGTTNPVSLIVE